MPTCCAYWLPGIPRQSNIKVPSQQRNKKTSTCGALPGDPASLPPPPPSPVVFPAPLPPPPPAPVAPTMPTVLLVSPAPPAVLLPAVRIPYRPDCQMHYLLVPESQRSATYALLSHSPSSRVVRPGRIFCLVSWTQPDSFHSVVGRLASLKS